MAPLNTDRIFPDYADAADGGLRAAACAAAFHAFVTATVTNHDGAARVACRRVAHIDESAHGIRSMD